MKDEALRRFLAFVARFVPLTQARLATLGGRGIEAKLWREAGIPPEHGWLIERSRSKNTVLIRDHRYRLLNRLPMLSSVLAGTGQSLDAFHLDLCGTFSGQSVADFASVLPLVLGGRGKCLAITVADARRNRILEMWPAYERRGRKLLASAAYESFVREQERLPVRRDLPAFMKGVDPEKAAKREFGLLVEFMELLAVSDPFASVEMERYVYVSRYGKKPFRMRTYFLHFDPAHRASRPLAWTWAKSPLYFGSNGAFEELTRAATPAPPQWKGEPLLKTPSTQPLSRLAALAAAAGGPAQEEYDALLARSHQLEALMNAIDGVRAGVQNGAAPHAQAVPARRKRTFEDLSPKEQIEWALSALELKVANGGSWGKGAWEKLLRETFGHYSPKLGRSLRAVLARTGGKFRAQFRGRIENVCGNDAGHYLERLTKLK